MFQYGKKNTDSQSLEEVYLKITVGDTAVPPGAKTAPISAVAESELLEILIEDNGMTAILRSHSRKSLSVSAKEILELMETYGVVSGIDYEAVDRAVLSLNKTGRLPADFIVAWGVPPTHPDTLVFPVLEQQSDPTAHGTQWFANGQPLDFNALRTALSAKQLQDIEGGSWTAMAVAPLDILATLKRHPDHNPGCNIFGLPSSAPDVLLKDGANVFFKPADGSFTATIYGYLHIEDNIISVLPPVWISPDHMSAYFINFPQAGIAKAPTVEQLHHVLIMEAILDVCIRQEALHELCERLGRHEEIPAAVLIARGFLPSPGADARFTCFFDTTPRAGTVRDDDSFDLRERNLVVSIEKGTLLAEKRLSLKGTSGATIFGKKVKTIDGVDNIPVTINENIRPETEKNIVRYYAKTNGTILYKDGRLAVVAVFRVQGDVDYSTGNIDVTTDLLVEGSVNPGFTVKSAGAIRIRGAVELGATVIANGDLIVEKGIIGDTTRVIALGNLQTSFIHDAEVIAKGDILVLSYTSKARIRSSGTVTVLRRSGSRQGGIIMGGFVCATKGIQVSTVGALANQNTVVALQNTPEDLLAQSKLNKEIVACSEYILKITRTLKINSLAPERIQALAAALPPKRREIFKKALQALNQFIKHREALKQQELKMKERMERELGEATIRVGSAFIQGNVVQIGDRKLSVPEDTGPIVFQLKDGAISC